MIIINKENLARHSNLKSHAADELEQRMEFNAIQKALTANLTHDSGSYVKNAAGKLKIAGDDDRVVAYSQEDYTVGDEPELVWVRGA